MMYRVPGQIFSYFGGITKTQKKRVTRMSSGFLEGFDLFGHKGALYISLLLLRLRDPREPHHESQPIGNHNS